MAAGPGAEDWVELTTVNSPYWEALGEGRLLFQRCESCGNAWLPPREHCPQCLQAHWRWDQATGRGHVVSWVVYHVAFHPAFADRLPYNVAIVELDEGPRLITNLLDVDPAQDLVGAPVTLEVQSEAGRSLARFRPAVDVATESVDMPNAPSL